MMSFEDIRALLDQALASPKGVRVFEKTPEQLIHLRQRIHKARAIDRKLSLNVFVEGDPRRGTSPYDTLSVCSPKGELFLEIVKREPGSLKVEEIT